MTVITPSRRHGSTRSSHRKWDDVTDWPFQFVILPVLVAAAFCLVLFLGAKQGTRLAAVRTWLSATPPCMGATCSKGVPDITAGSGGAVVGQTAVGLEKPRAGNLAGPGGWTDAYPLPLSNEDKLKFDFRYWVSEGAKLVGSQTKDCDAEYGLPFIERWRKSQINWCTAGTGSAAAAGKAPRIVAATSRRLTEAAKEHANGSANSKGGGVAVEQNATWRAGNATAAPPAPASSWRTGVTSTIVLYPHADKQARSMFAVSTNTVVNTSAFLGSLPGMLPAAPRGSYLAACSVANSVTPGLGYMKLEAVRRWVVDALESEKYDDVSTACAASAAGNASSAQGHGPVLHPVLLLSRWDTTNAFRTMEEVMNTFLTLAVLDDKVLMTQGLQVVIADGRPDGFYLDLWASLSRPYPLRILPKSPWPPNTCLTRAIHNSFGNTSILTSMSVAKRTTCRSPLVVGAALWLRHMLGPAMQNTLRSAYQAPLQTKGITRKTLVWISRRNYEGQTLLNLTSWQNQRRFSNEGEVVLELQREVWRWNDEACARSGLSKSFGTRRRDSQRRRLLAVVRGIADEQQWPKEDLGQGLDGADVESGSAIHLSANGERGAGGSADGSRRLQAAQRCRQSNVIFDLRTIELSDMPFYPDQLQVLSTATIMAGAHGAGLANMMWMSPGKGGVLELHHNSAGNEQFHNQAHMLGHKYVSVESDGDRVELPEAAAGLRKLLDLLGAALD